MRNSRFQDRVSDDTEMHAIKQAAKYLRSSNDLNMSLSLYDMDKAEILKEFFNRFTLEELIQIKNMHV